MRENFTSGSVGRAPGNRRLYPEADPKSGPLINSLYPIINLIIYG